MMSRAGMEIAQEAFEKGFEQGLKEAREEVLTEILPRLIERRFQPVSEEVRVRLAKASETELDRWLDRILDAKSLEELFAEP